MRFSQQMVFALVLRTFWVEAELLYSSYYGPQPILQHLCNSFFGVSHLFRVSTVPRGPVEYEGHL